MSEILENALDSLRMGLRHHLDRLLENKDKWAILELFHCIELILKERLYLEHPLLIYRTIEQPVNDDSRTVSLAEALARLENANVLVDKEYRGILLNLQRRRNRIEHHRFVSDKSHEYVLAKAIKFIRDFLETELDTDIEAELPPEQLADARELLFSYEELVNRAKAEVTGEIRKYPPKDQLDFDVAECPKCWNETLLVRPDDRGVGYCYFCNGEVYVKQCERCGRYFSPESLADSEVCEDCWASILDG